MVGECVGQAAMVMMQGAEKVERLILRIDSEKSINNNIV